MSGAWTKRIDQRSPSFTLENRSNPMDAGVCRSTNANTPTRPTARAARGQGRGIGWVRPVRRQVAEADRRCDRTFPRRRKERHKVSDRLTRNSVGNKSLPHWSLPFTALQRSWMLTERVLGQSGSVSLKHEGALSLEMPGGQATMKTEQVGAD